jgi:uncharacterized protein (TIGR02679 family)
MTCDIDPRLWRLLGGDRLANLRKRLRRHFERVELTGQVDVFRLTELTQEEREALASLMGCPPSRAKSMKVDVEVIDTALNRAGVAASLRQALEWLDGPILNKANVRAELQALWSEIVAGTSHRCLAAFLQTPAGLGLLKRLSRQDLARATRLCENVDVVLSRLPANGLSRAQLAAETLGDAHALDAERPTSTLVLATWRHSEGASEATNDSKPRKAERTREIWARVGILVNELAKPALFLNLPFDGSTSPTPGEPAYVSLRLLLRSPPAWRVTGMNIYVCENPNLLAIAADRLGSGCAPLVCTDGMPAAAQRTLLTQLTAAGARLLYHGDFDWPGIQIANHVIGVHGAQPWRFSAADYQAVVPLVPRRGHRLAGAQVRASWDAALDVEMRAHGLAIPEESLATVLLQDLSDEHGKATGPFEDCVPKRV